MQHRFIVFCLILVLSKPFVWSQSTAEQHLRIDIGVLAHDSLFGRGSGTINELRAAEYVADEFRKAGLTPYLHEDQSYIHDFYYQNYRYLKCTFSCNGTSYTYGKDFGAVAGSASAETIQARVVSYLTDSGTIADHYYDSKAVLINLQGSRHWQQAEFETAILRMQQAQTAGAAAILIYCAGNETFRKKLFTADSMPEFKLPVLYLSKELGRTCAELKDANCEISVTIDKHRTPSHNVMGYLDKGADQTIVIGAHYDHVGISGPDSAYIGNPRIHNGADDNASGTAVMMELARWASKQSDLRYNLLFIAFGSEELGLHGSGHFCNSRAFTSTPVAWMLNLDMVGRFNWNGKKQLYILGLGSSNEWKSHLRHIDDKAFRIRNVKGAPAFSDHHPFYKKGIPVIYFTTGLHNEYHKPVDDAGRINYAGAADIVQYIENLVTYMQTQPPPAFRRIKGIEQFNAVMRLLILK